MNESGRVGRALAGLVAGVLAAAVASGDLAVASVPEHEESTATAATTPQVGSESGYGPWRFGMSLEQVTAIEAHAPYEAVMASMGGVETGAGELGGGVESISFVFNSADQLYLIRLWYDLGDDYQDKLTAFHRSYVHLTETFGPAQVDTGYPLDPGMSAEEFTALVPDRFAPTGEEFDMDDGMRSDFQMDVRQLRIEPMAKPDSLRVFTMFAKLHPTTGYIVNVFYQSLVYTQ